MAKEQDDLLKSIGIDIEDDELLPNETLPNDDDEDLEDVQEPNPVAEDKGTTEPVEDVAAKPAQAQQQENASGFDPMGRYAADKKGNLIDKAGKIIVRSGSERNLFQKMRDALIKSERDGVKLAKRLDELARLTNVLYRKHQDLIAAKTYASTKGLTEEENRLACDMAAMSKVDPLGAARMHLTKLHLAGIDISSLGAAGAVDAKSIAAEVRKQVEATLAAQKPPATSPEDDQKSQMEAEARDFLVENQDAVPFVAQIGQAKQRYPNMSLTEIWLRLKNAMLEQGKVAPKAATDPVVVPPTIPATRNGRRGRIPPKEINTSSSYADIGNELLKELRAMEQ